ncbi:hypothetical protein K488DRAFT_81466 [Vararia minispora EC-137]|uniref:Uncharacterized protein n=1 Tax=Vararia minispora EC-137 TaxID=1314806 RepID=A0ACB8R0D3_9AGAM|nr:hypothetical protein K488DRAFT_81466 [Vararia minispora EC-137]
MAPSTPPPTTQHSDDRPTLPVSHPRSSPRSPPRHGAPQPPISPPKAGPVPSLSSASTLASSISASSATLSALSSQTSIADSVLASDDAKSLASQSSSTVRTPNVYINGLPPNFPEDQLYTMTAEFGPVISVRTFTRHVSDRPSGYGFVLFESVDSAEKCIDALRLYRNLHPSFSKQVHKIPGTAYANVPAAAAAAAASPSASDPTTSDTFKNRMERLKDPSSTNLYIEGLPLTIDEPTLGALVVPYAIKSSRFFQTRLSHPPRIIAFVRLESRTACEEIIERLHGRMVRGWNDTGSRISVRFADSAEQRELRRNERTGREGDPSPARLTMAQAALLSLRGQQASTASPPAIGASGLASPPPSHDRSQLPLHPMTTQYSQLASLASPTPTNAEINLSVMRNANAAVAGLTSLEQHLFLQAQIDARTQALADLRLLADRRSPYQAQPDFIPVQPPIGRPLSRLNALSSKEFVPRGLAGFQPQQPRPQPSVMSEDEFHRLPSQQFGDETAQSKVLYDSEENANRARAAAVAFTMPPPPVPRESHTRSSTLPPQLMHNAAESSEQVQARLSALLSPPLRQNPNAASAQLNIAVPAPKQAPPAEDSPLLVPSPALTYNSSASSAALSPATPFFGNFANGDGAFGGQGVYRGDPEGNKVPQDVPGLNYGGVGVGLEPLRAQ